MRSVCSYKMYNTSEEFHFVTDESVENVSQAFQSFPKPGASQLATVIVGLVAAVTGTCANAVVLAVLVFARRHFGSSVNTLITNQSVMDLFACIFIIIGLAMALPGAPPNYPWLGQSDNKAVCFLFRSRLLALFCLASGKIGLALSACRSLVYDTEMFFS